VVKLNVQLAFVRRKHLGMTKAFNIPKKQVVAAYKLVKANAGSAGVDQQSLEDFEKNLKDNLYKIWNRLSSGSYFPPPVMAVSIPKKSGGERILGVPTVADRIAQMVVKLSFEPEVEPHFLEDSYGYRPNKSALDAVGVTRKRCWNYNWVVEFDIKGLFDNIPHDLLLKAVHKHTKCKWVIIYIKRWLKAPLQSQDGTLYERRKGVPQGGVISPILSNLFLHYTFDKWMNKNHQKLSWCRYADDGLVHCCSQEQSEYLLKRLKERFQDCGLELHPDKTKIIYCKDSNRKGDYCNTSFDFLGFTFRPRLARKQKTGQMFVSFTPAISKCSSKSIKDKIRKWKLKCRVGLSIENLALLCNPSLRGWKNYYGAYYPSMLESVWMYVNSRLMKWAMRKYKKITSKTKSDSFIKSIQESRPNLFEHWKLGYGKSFT
jgi:RNA-directed DNA polymerase